MLQVAGSIDKKGSHIIPSAQYNMGRALFNVSYLHCYLLLEPPNLGHQCMSRPDYRWNYSSLPSDICRAKRTNVRSKLSVV